VGFNSLVGGVPFILQCIEQRLFLFGDCGGWILRFATSSVNLNKSAEEKVTNRCGNDAGKVRVRMRFTLYLLGVNKRKIRIFSWYEGVPFGAQASKGLFFGK